MTRLCVQACTWIVVVTAVVVETIDVRGDSATLFTRRGMTVCGIVMLLRKSLLVRSSRSVLPRSDLLPNIDEDATHIQSRTHSSHAPQASRRRG